MTMSETLYSILGLASTDCTAGEIRKSYLRLARKTHPDMAATGQNGRDDQFKRVNEAYCVLSDESRRREYDESLLAVLSPRVALDQRARPSFQQYETHRQVKAPGQMSASYRFAHEPARTTQQRSPELFGRRRSTSSMGSSSESELDSLDDVRSRRRFRRPPSDTSDDDDDDDTTWHGLGYKGSRHRSSSTSSDETVDSPTDSYLSARSRPSSPRPPPTRWQSSPHVPYAPRYQSPPPIRTRSRVPSRTPSYEEDLDWVERLERAELLEAQAQRRSRSRATVAKPSRVSSPDSHSRYGPTYSRQSSTDYFRSPPLSPTNIDPRPAAFRTVSPAPPPAFTIASYPTYEPAPVRVVRKRGALPGPPPSTITSSSTSRGSSGTAALKSFFSRGPPKPPVPSRPPPSAYSSPPPPSRWNGPRLRSTAAVGPPGFDQRAGQPGWVRGPSAGSRDVHGRR